MNVFVLADLSMIVTEAWVWFVAPVAAVAALVSALVLSKNVMAYSEGDDDMIEIASAVRAGAMAYLKRQYKVVAMVFAVLLVILTGLGFAGILSLVTPVGVLFACVFSGTCGCVLLFPRWHQARPDRPHGPLRTDRPNQSSYQ